MFIFLVVLLKIIAYIKKDNFGSLLDPKLFGFFQHLKNAEKSQFDDLRK